MGRKDLTPAQDAKLTEIGKSGAGFLHAQMERDGSVRITVTDYDSGAEIGTSTVDRDGGVR